MPVVNLDFSDITKTELPFEWGGKKYVLVEASGAQMVKYRNMGLRAAKMSDGKFSMSDLTGLADTDPFLISSCVREVMPDGHGSHRPVSVEEVKEFPARVMNRLADAARKVCGLDDAANGTDDRAGAFADLLARPDSPITYEVMRDFIRKALAEDERFRPLDSFLEDVKDVTKK